MGGLPVNRGEQPCHAAGADTIFNVCGCAIPKMLLPSGSQTPKGGGLRQPSMAMAKPGLTHGLVRQMRVAPWSAAAELPLWKDADCLRSRGGR